MHGYPVRRIQRRTATRFRTTNFAVKTSMAPACSTFQCHVVAQHELTTAVYNMATYTSSMVSLTLQVVPYHLSLDTVVATSGHRCRGFETTTSTYVYASASARQCMVSVRCGVERTGCESVSAASISGFPSFSSLDKRGVEGKQRLRKSRLLDWMWWLMRWWRRSW